MIFFYDIYPQGKKILGDLGVTLHCAHHLVGRAGGRQGERQVRAKMLAEVEKFMNDPAGWSKAHGGVAKRRNRKTSPALSAYAVHSFSAGIKAWMAGTSPAMTI